MDTGRRSSPLVSIGLPVYNGEKYLEESVRSMLSQTLDDFELIICDNCSTDRTYEICKEFACSDSRIRLYRNESNIGVARNHNRTFELSTGKYFRWAACDDICAPELLEKCVRTIDANPDVVLCYFWFFRIFEIGAGGQVLVKPLEGTETNPSRRFRSVSDHGHACEQAYGLFRSEYLRNMRLLRNYTDSDRTMLSELSLRGRFFVVPEPLFYKRFHAENNYRNRSVKMITFDEAYRDKVVFPYVIQFFDQLSTIKRVPLPLGEKLKCYGVMMGWPLRARYRLAKEFLIAGQTIFRRLVRRDPLPS